MCRVSESHTPLRSTASRWVRGLGVQISSDGLVMVLGSWEEQGVLLFDRDLHPVYNKKNPPGGVPAVVSVTTRIRNRFLLISIFSFGISLFFFFNYGRIVPSLLST